MNKRLRPLIILLGLAGLGYGLYAYVNRPPTSLLLTGIVTTNDVIVSPQIAGQIGRMLVAEGDQVKQLPVLIVGFDPQGRAARIWTLTTH